MHGDLIVQYVYVNGMNVGRGFAHTSRLNREVPNNGHFTIGRDSNEKSTRQGWKLNLLCLNKNVASYYSQ